MIDSYTTEPNYFNRISLVGLTECFLRKQIKPIKYDQLEDKLYP